MKTYLSLTLLAILGTASAESPLKQLRLQYNKDRTEAVSLVDKRFILSLQGELKRAMAKNDLETANDIKTWIADLQVESAAKPSAGALASTLAQDVRDFFIGSTW